MAQRVKLLIRQFVTDDQILAILIRLRPLQRPVLRWRAWARKDLDALACLHGTDESSWGHGYAKIYEQFLRPRRKRVRKVLEIGVGGADSHHGYESNAGGRSLRMWRDYFPKATILGIDLHQKDVADDRIAFERGDQSDPDFLRRVAQTYGPFDLIIDDGSHIGRHQAASLAGLWDALEPGGYYVIEDLETSYHASFEGGPPGTPETAAALIKDKVDETLRRWGQPLFRPTIASMHIYGEIAFLHKA